MTYEVREAGHVIVHHVRFEGTESWRDTITGSSDDPGLVGTYQAVQGGKHTIYSARLGTESVRESGPSTAPAYWLGQPADWYARRGMQEADAPSDQLRLVDTDEMPCRVSETGTPESAGPQTTPALSSGLRPGCEPGETSITFLEEIVFDRGTGVPLLYRTSADGVVGAEYVVTDFEVLEAGR